MASRPRTMRSSEIVQHLTWRGSFAKDFRRKMKGLISRSMRRVIRKAGYDVVLHDPFRGDYPSDFSSEHISILNKVRGRTMTSPNGSTLSRKQLNTSRVRTFREASLSAECGGEAV